MHPSPDVIMCRKGRFAKAQGISGCGTAPLPWHHNWEPCRAALFRRALPQDAETLAFLDHRPLFPGHTLLIIKSHFTTLADLPDEFAAAAMRNTQLLSRAVQEAMQAEGTFIAINNIVSQSVPHFHVHIVPRRKGDGLRGFFWPRGKYGNDEEARAIAERIKAVLVRLQSGRHSPCPEP